jgi:transketolase
MKLKGEKEKVVVISSDGEQDEGSVWEAVMFAGFHKMDNVALVIDQNGMQIGGRIKTVLDTDPLADKYRAFGWMVEQIDGHDYRSIIGAFSNFNEKKGKPKVVICRTVRGKGVSFMENSNKYHACTLSEDEYKKAMEELS